MRASLDMAVAPADPMPLFDRFCDASGRCVQEFEAWKKRDRAADGDALASALERRVRELGHDVRRSVGGGTVEVAEQLEFVLTGLIDDYLLFGAGDWPGRDHWLERPLELRLFKTTRAGDVIPDAMQAALQDRDPSRRDLAAVYLACLVLGFRGRMRTPGDKETVAAWHAGLYQRAFGADLTADRLADLLSSQVQPPPVRRPVRSALSDFRYWARLLGLLVLSVFALVHFYWWGVTVAPVRAELSASDSSPQRPAGTQR